MELKRIMQDAGMIGAGGAGFPSYAKLSVEANVLLINGAECEPLLYTDYIILRDEIDTVLTGIRTVRDELSIKDVFLCIKHFCDKIIHSFDNIVVNENFLWTYE